MTSATCQVALGLPASPWSPCTSMARWAQRSNRAMGATGARIGQRHWRAGHGATAGATWVVSNVAFWCVKAIHQFINLKIYLCICLFTCMQIRRHILYYTVYCVDKYIYDVYMCGCVEKLASGHTCIIMYLDRSVMHDLCVCA